MPFCRCHRRLELSARSSFSPVRHENFSSLRSSADLSGDHFDGSPCEYEVEIGSSYRCPVTSLTSTTLTCRIGNETRLFYQPSGYLVRVNRRGQGYLTSPNVLRFSFQTAITQITPTSGKSPTDIGVASHSSSIRFESRWN